jgi:hypothetical protein
MKINPRGDGSSDAYNDPYMHLAITLLVMSREDAVHAAPSAAAGVEHGVGEVHHRELRVPPRGGRHVHLRAAAPLAGAGANEGRRHPADAELDGRGQRRRRRMLSGGRHDEVLAGEDRCRTGRGVG